MRRSVRQKKLKIKKFYIILSAVTLAAFLLSLLARQFPGLVEKIYSGFLYKLLSQVFGLVFGIFPVSVAEILFYALLLLLAAYTIYTFIKTLLNIVLKKKKPFRPCLNWLLVMLAGVMLIYSSFNFMWAFNYSRQPFAVINGWEVKEAPVSELYELCAELAKKCNELRKKVKTNSDGVMVSNRGKEDALKRARRGYVEASKDYPSLRGLYSRPKGLTALSSKIFCYTGVEGMFVPFTYEANVNMMAPDSSLLHTIMHEMAHQRGFSREDEANFIGYLACKYHPDYDFQYSGYYHALIQSLNTLYRYDNKKAEEIMGMLSDGVRKDMEYENAFWKQFESPIEEIATAINDNYLKANHQYDGVYSYGRVVDLLLAERRHSSSKN